LLTGPRAWTAKAGSSAAPAVGDAATGQADRPTMRLRLGGNHAPQLPAPHGHNAEDYRARFSS